VWFGAFAGCLPKTPSPTIVTPEKQEERGKRKEERGKRKEERGERREERGKRREERGERKEERGKRREERGEENEEEEEEENLSRCMGDPLVLTLLNVLVSIVLALWNAFAWISWFLLFVVSSFSLLYSI